MEFYKTYIERLHLNHTGGYFWYLKPQRLGRIYERKHMKLLTVSTQRVMEILGLPIWLTVAVAKSKSTWL